MTTNVFGRLALRLDPWQAEFGPEFSGLDDHSMDPGEDAELEIERKLAFWAPLDAEPMDSLPADVWFIDGVRRLEARVIARIEDSFSHGAFGSYAVGAVRLTSTSATFDRYITGRILAVCGSELPPREIHLTPALVYRPVRVSESEPDAPVRAIHSEMRKTEEVLGRELAADSSLVVADGPLTFEEPSRGAAVGYIKRVMRVYLPKPQLALLAELKLGQRTPLIALRTSKRFSRLSWFLRLAEPRRGDSEFSGIVRLEVAESVGVPRAQALASACCLLLPDMRARRGLDNRAPQNLLPIAALENFLRRKLGDERTVRRRIESFLAKEAS
jgi:hypothetical protein